jgi:uncharacterized MnhB-related membrane protein
LIPFELIVFIVVAAGGTGVALTRDPLRQAMSAGIFGLSLVVLFFLYQAPDVALSMITVSALLLPVIILVALAKVRRPEQ